jgi:hypothetical protein
MSAVGIIGIVLLIVAAISFFIHRDQKNKSFSLKSARSVTVAELQHMAKEIAGEIGGGNWRDYVKIWGKIQVDPPLVSELKQEPCVYYSMSVTREYEETVTEKDSEGKTVRRTNRGSETVAQNKQSIPFQLQDSTGSITVDPEGAGIETVKVLDEFKPGHESGGMISFGRFSRTLSMTSPGQRKTLGYRYCESLLPTGREVLVVGMISDDTGTLRLSQPIESGKKFIVSLKPYEALAKNADQGAKTAFYVAAIAVGVGLLLVLLDLVF